MSYVRHIPAPPLNRYVESIYYLDGRMPFRHEKILPLPALDLKINLGGDFRLYEQDGQAPSRRLHQGWLVGLYARHHRIEWPREMRLYAVSFKPNGAYPFLDFPLSELYNQVIELDAVWGRWAAQIREQLSAAPSIEAGLRLLERFLLARLREEPHLNQALDYAVSEFSRTRGAISIRDLSEKIGFSQNHLGTLFKRMVGTSAKELSRLYRFEHVLRAVNSLHPPDWTRIAQQCGYYDQSHLNKDFATFAGHSPSDYWRLRQRIHKEGAVVDQTSLRTLPSD